MMSSLLVLILHFIVASDACAAGLVLRLHTCTVCEIVRVPIPLGHVSVHIHVHVCTSIIDDAGKFTLST